jgi:hypothetical protein
LKRMVLSINRSGAIEVDGECDPDGESADLKGAFDSWFGKIFSFCKRLQLIDRLIARLPDLLRTVPVLRQYRTNYFSG